MDKNTQKKIEQIIKDYQNKQQENQQNPYTHEYNCKLVNSLRNKTKLQEKFIKKQEEEIKKLVELVKYERKEKKSVKVLAWTFVSLVFSIFIFGLISMIYIIKK